MKLTGWQRLCVVVSVVWTAPVGLMIWQTWPNPAPVYVSLFASGMPDESSGTLPEVAYLYVVAKLRLQGPYPEGFEPDPEGLPLHDVGPKIPVSGIGTVVFPQSFSQSKAQAEAKHLNDEHQRQLDARNRELLESRSAQVRRALRIAALAWLIPLVAVYALGWSVGWVLRGFKQTHTERERHDTKT